MLDSRQRVTPEQFSKLVRLISMLEDVPRDIAIEMILETVGFSPSGGIYDDDGRVINVKYMHKRSGLPFRVSDGIKAYVSARFDKTEVYFVQKCIWGLDVKPSITSANPARSIDKFDLMRELVQNMQNLSDYLKSVNDPDVVDADIKALKAYLRAFLEFLDTQSVSDLPEEIPSAIPERTSALLSKIDWSKTSAEVRGWAKTISDLIRMAISG